MQDFQATGEAAAVQKKGMGHEIEKRNMKYLNFRFTFLWITFRFPGFLSNVDPEHRL
jgi:hypothetical protein